MRMLHTADWHAGKKLGRIDRSHEFEEVFDELIAISVDQDVDLVVVAGDLFDRAAAPLDAIGLVVNTLLRLADGGRKVVAIPGNHDSPHLFEILAPLLEPRGIVIGSRIRRPEEGGIVKIPSRDGSVVASVGLFPFLHEAHVVDFMKDEQEWFKSYADKIRLISTAFSRAFDPKGVGIIAGHWFVENAMIGGGERKIHLGSQYAATSHSIPPGASYVALGHIHRAQAIGGSAVPSRYSGSLLALDFAERSYEKEVVIVDLEPGKPAKAESIPLRSGRKLVRVEGTLEELRTMAPSLQNAYLDVRVRTEGPVIGLSDQVREFLGGNVVLVQGIYERTSAPILTTDPSSTITERYAQFHASDSGHGVPAPQELIEQLREIEEEVLREAP